MKTTPSNIDTLEPHQIFVFGSNLNANTAGDKAHANTAGDYAHASVKGRDSIAVALGNQSKAKGALGCWIVLVEWKQNDDYTMSIVQVKTAKVDGKKIKADTYYRLKDGKFIEDQG